MFDSQSLVITHICGGLGNQMFQHAAGRALALRHGVELLWDSSWYDNMAGCTPRSFMLPIFPSLAKGAKNGVALAKKENIAALKYTPQTWLSKTWHCFSRRPVPHGAAFIQEPHPQYWPDIARLSPPLYIQGYWQSEQYFCDCEQYIRQDFAFPPVPEKSQALLESICTTENAVSIHIRRGDYAHNVLTNSVHGVCSKVYYSTAVTLLREAFSSIHLFVFSDEPAWAKKYFDSCQLPCTVVDLHSDVEAYHDMHMMALCKHHVIANSTFSWWGAWLASKSGIIIVPKQWFCDPQYSSINIAANGWVLI